MANDHTLSAMPEEILVMIFRECFANLAVRRRPSPGMLHLVKNGKKTQYKTPEAMSVLFVSKKFLRVALPQFYSTTMFLHDDVLCLVERFSGKPGPSKTFSLSLIRNIYTQSYYTFRVNLEEQFGIFPLQQLRTVRLETHFHPTYQGSFV